MSSFTPRDAWRATGVLGTILAISSLHYVTPPSRTALHELYSYACYVPIIAAAYWYGIAGGVLSAIVASVAFVPHIRMTWADNPAYTASQYAEAIVYHILGITVGLLAGRQQRLTARYREAATALEQANRELRESHEQLLRADRLSTLGEISAGLAHEIGNPLAGLKGALEIMASRASPNTPEAEFTNVGRKEIARLERLVREFLAYGRPRDPVRHPTSASDLLDRVATLLHGEADEKGVNLVVEAPHHPITLNVDAEQLTQVLLNIVLNGIQATAAGKTVRMSAAREREFGHIVVSDEGSGIAPEHLPRVFDPFFTTKPRGTGLGLATSQRIVAAHGGTIAAVTARPSGTTFYVRLPLT